MLNDNEDYFNRTFPVCKEQFLFYCALRKNDHEHDERNEEHDRKNDCEAIEVLLNDARAVARVVKGARNGIGNARSLSGMQHDEDDQAGTRHDKQDQEDDKQRGHDSSLSRIAILVRPIRTKQRL